MTQNLETWLKEIHVPADWIGVRQVTETSTLRYVRDGKPQSNGRTQTKGVMVEVLAKGQMGYCATNHLTSHNSGRVGNLSFHCRTTPTSSRNLSISLR